MVVTGPQLAAQPTRRDIDLARELDPLLVQAESQGLRSGVVVLDPRRREIRYRHRSTEAFLPASNQKLLTVAAALRGLGADYRFRTVFRLRQGVLEVLAAGDPNWQTGGDHDPGRIFAAVARRLKDAGVRALRGIRLRQGRFLGPLRPPGWPADQFHTDYCAATAGLATDAGCFLAEVRPAGGKHAVVRVLAPWPSLRVTGSIEVVSRPRAKFGLRDAGDHLVAHGSIHRRSPTRTIRGPLQDPAAGFAGYLEHSLARAGIHVDAGAPVLDRDVLVYETTLRGALPAVLRDSSNFHAELLLRVLGAEREGDGSYQGGARAVQAQLRAMVGSLPSSLRVADGSGLSRENRVTPLLIARVLQATLTSEHGKELVAAMAQGQRSGTLQKRFRRRAFAPKVFAKTGTLDGVSCLSGVLTDADGRLMVFAICMNAKKRHKGPTMRRLQEDIVAAVWNTAEGSNGR